MGKSYKLTGDEIGRITDCYMISKGKDDDGCGVAFQVVPLSGSRICFNIKANFRVAMIRSDEFVRILNMDSTTVYGWIRKKFIRSKKIDKHRWLDIDSAIDFLKTYHYITMKQQEDFDTRLIEAYDTILYLKTKEASMANIVLSVI